MTLIHINLDQMSKILHLSFSSDSSPSKLR